MKGLSFLYLPPFSIVARFMVTGSLMGILVALYSLYMVYTSFSYLPPLVHLFTVGFMSSFMIGALFQMLPVVAGAVIENPLPKATISHITLTLSALIFPIALTFRDSYFSILAVSLLAFSLLFPSLIFIRSLFNVESHTPTVRGMKVSVAIFPIGVIVGIVLYVSITKGLIDPSLLVKFHLGLMIFGWTLNLIASVAFQVIEMFFVTPPYPKPFAKTFPLAVVLFTAIAVLMPDQWIFKIPLSVAMILFALLTTTRLMKRKRKIPDPLVSFWYVAMAFLSLSAIVYPFATLYSPEFWRFLLIYGIFVQSTIFAMAYRIIPFLVFMHLSQKGIPNTPTMHQVISPKSMWISFYISLISSLWALTSAFLLSTKSAFFLAGMLYLLNFTIFSLNLINGVWVYIRKIRSQPEVFSL